MSCFYRHFCLFFRVLGALIAVSFSSAQADSVVWTTTDAPPFHILSGKYAGQGVCDVLIKDITERLPQFEHELLQLPQARMDKMLRSGEPLCFPCLIRKSSEDEFIYSDAINIRQPHRLILNPSSYQAIKAQYGEPVSLTRLLADEHFRFGYPLGRKYGSLQPLIDEHGVAGYNKLSLPVEKSVPELVSMERLDYSIDYEMVANYYRRVKGKTLYLLKIEENYGQEITGAVGCTNSDWGQRAITAINRVLPEVLESSAYRQSLHFWFGDSLIYPKMNRQE